MIDTVAGLRVSVIRQQSNIFFYLRQLVNQDILTDRRVIDRINEMRHSDDIEILNLAEIILVNIYNEQRRSLRANKKCNGHFNDKVASSLDSKDGKSGIDR